MIRNLLIWLEHRTGVATLTREALYERVPGGARWRYVWGSTLVFAFVVQAITGVVLWMAYSPSDNTAWESVSYIQFHMQGGWLLRGIHHFMAQAMIVLLALHFVQVIIDGAYKAPREVNFWLGLILMQIVLALSLTGYLLPWDQKGYWATRVATNLMGLAPFVGKELQQLVVGGNDYNHHTVTRFFALHAGVLPGLLVLLLAAHIAVFRRHGLTAKPPETNGKNMKLAIALAALLGPVGMFYSTPLGAVTVGLLALAAKLFMSGGLLIAAIVVLYLIGIAWSALAVKNWRPSRDCFFWPDQVLKDSVACLAVLAVVMGLTLYFGGAELTAPADGAKEYSAARPEWYFLFLFQFLKVFEGYGETGEFVGAIVIPGLVMGLMFLMPFIGRSKTGHVINVALMFVLLVGAGWLTFLAMYEDTHDPSFQRAKWVAEQNARLAAHFAQNEGIPPEGAKRMMRKHPRGQALRVITENCLACHSYLSPDGDGMSPDEPTAPNLHGFGTARWVEGLLDKDQIGGKHYFGNTKIMDKGEGMVSFVKDEMSASPEKIKEIAAALAAEADDKMREKDKEKRVGVLRANGCMECHPYEGESDERMPAPMLDGWGSTKWLMGMIKDPNHADFYSHLGEDQTMPAFGKDMNDEVIREIALWLRGEWYPKKTEDAGE